MTARQTPLTLIGEEIAGEWNTEALAAISRAFGGDYIGLRPQTPDTAEGEPAAVLDRFDWLMAAENSANAANIYDYRPPPQGRRALIVGNEAKGLRRRTLKRANAVIEIPIASRNINCLNVAAAAAVMLHYLSLDEALTLKQRTLSSVQKNRPDILLLSGRDHRELGSVIRSACAFGWSRVFLQDRYAAWYECDRAMKSEGRGAARRGRNPIRVIPYAEELATRYKRFVIFTTDGRGRKPHSLPLTGNDLLVVLEDEQDPCPPWLPPDIRPEQALYAALPPIENALYHYRQTASIALAEIARQLGSPGSEGIYLRGKRDRYRKEIEAEPAGITVDLEDLSLF